ncbi:MAG TPA: ABC transporter permease subunit [Chloroflexota bacterium]|nr:ABC transporter permease subunit [Chloroflexota bacterium]
MTPNPVIPAARIVDRGYQRYDGVRLGPSHALWTIVRGAMARAMGVRRPFRAKILPWLLIIVAYLPVVVLLGIQTQIQHFPGFHPPLLSSLFGRNILTYILFAGLAAPELLCADRREQVLSLYYAAPITRLHYIGAKSFSLILLLLAVTLLPALLLFTGYALLSDSFASYVRDHGADLGHLLLGGSLLALYYGAVALAVSAFTDRRAYAAGAFLGLLLVTSAAAGILSHQMTFAGHERFALLDLLNAPIQTVNWLFGQPLRYNLSGWSYLGVTAAAIAVSLALLAWRYLRGDDR